MKTLHDLTAGLADAYPGALPVQVAQHAILQCVLPIAATQPVATCDALGCVLAQNLISPIDVPAHDNSAMDGYAFDGAQLAGGDLALRVVGTAYAGRPYEGATHPGECVRIMTGAVMPAQCDTVAPQEVCDVVHDQITIPAKARLRRGDNRRVRGEDLARDQIALHVGKRLMPADIGLIASLGVAQIPVQRRLRVACFSTGDELRSLGEPLGAGQIYDSNRYTIRCMLERLGVEVIDLGLVGDDPASLETALRHASTQADAIVTSGGVGAGDADYIRPLMAKLGEVVFWSLAIRPGRPMAFGRIWPSEHGAGRSAYLFGLPGNPVAVMVAFYQFVRPALLRLQGAAHLPLPLLQARTIEPLRKRPGRTEYQRGVVERDALGEAVVRSTGSQGSGVLRSMTEANCFIVLHHDQADVPCGERVDVLLFEGLV